MTWEVVTAISALLSALALVVGSVFVVVELRHIEKDRYVTIVGDVFRIWQSRDFLQDQFWILQHAQETTWEAFLRAHGEDAERRFYRLGGYYNHIGSLMSLGLLDNRLLLPSIAGGALAVWAVLEPLIYDLRRAQGTEIFNDFEDMLPVCRTYLAQRRTAARRRPTDSTEAR